MFYGAQKSKSKIAGLCKTIADLAAKGDELSIWIFNEAGKELAKLLQAIYPHAHKVILKKYFIIIFSYYTELLSKLYRCYIKKMEDCM